MALRNAFGDLALETTQVSVDSHLAAMESHMPVQDAKMDTLHEDMASNLFHKLQGTDIFGNTVVSQRINQIEVPLNDTNWIDYVDVSGTGTAAQGNGQVQISSGTGTNGSYKVISKDFVQYRSGSEIGWGFTWRFPTVGVLGSYQRIGATDNTWANGVWIGYEAAAFGISYARNGSVLWTRTQAQWLDPCDGSVGSEYTLNGSPVALDKTKDQLIRIRAGLFGHAGFIVEIRTPDGHWLKITEYTGINSDTVAVFGDFDLKVAMEVKKTGADATNLQLVSACWAGWTGVSQMRMNSTITDRTLAQTTRTVIEGKTTAGGGGYVPVKVNPSGALTADVTGSSVSLDATTLAALESVNVQNTVTVQATDLDVRNLTYAQDKVDVTGSTVTANVTGNVSVTNHPSEYPLPAAQVTTLTPQTDALTNTELRASDVNVADSGEREYLHFTADVLASDDTTLITPAAGKRIRIRWIYLINSPTAETPVKMKVRFGSNPPIYNVYALSKRQMVTGGINESLILNLSAIGDVAVTVIYEEI